jgi:hypothetical protein
MGKGNINHLGKIDYLFGQILIINYVLPIL